VVIALVVKFVGVGWINKLMPTVVIGPTVAVIGLSLAGNAVGDILKGNVTGEAGEVLAAPFVCLLCGLVTLGVTMLCATFGKKMIRLIPFIMGILAGYAVAAVFTIIGNAAGIDALKVLNFGAFSVLTEGGIGLHTFFSVPKFTFFTALGGFGEISGSYIASIAVAYIPVAFVVFAEHIADHKNISTIIEKDLLEEPGLHRTLLGDGIGSIAGAFFGGCPNTTYGESVGCVAITRNASVITITTAAIMCMVISFFGPFVTFLSSIPNCVMGGVCVALYGFIAVSGLKMIQQVNLNAGKNLFVVSAILIPGIGGLSVSFGKVTLTTIACALILGIITNVILSKGKED
jgi:uracil permease